MIINDKEKAMRLKRYPAIMLVCAAASPVMAGPVDALPNWSQLEASYVADGSVADAQRWMTRDLPAGSSSAVAVAALQRSGATCRASRHSVGTLRCLIHQYSLADDAADDVRWTVSMATDGGQIRSVDVSRYVDRHGTS